MIGTTYEVIDCLYAAGAVDVTAVLCPPEAGDVTLTENEFAVLRSGSQSALTRRIGNERWWTKQYLIDDAEHRRVGTNA